jgi:endonuclease YncB( thermonuclease family)
VGARGVMNGGTGMSLYLIKGQYRIVHSEPDGDSVHFFPDDTEAFTSLHLAAHLGGGGAAQLRLDAIDALETHYTPATHGARTLHQPLDLAHAAGGRLLDLLGFTDVVRDGETVTGATPDATPGYILTRFADKYGRPVSLAYAGATDRPDQQPVFTDVGLLRGSVNYQLLSEGLVYPTFYSRLYPDLRADLTVAAADARGAKAGVWASDATTSGATIQTLADLTDRLVIMPKLFRRLAEYFALGAGDVSLAGFMAFLASHNDRLYVISDGHATGFDTVVEVDGHTVRLTRDIADLIFIEG